MTSAAATALRNLALAITTKGINAAGEDLDSVVGAIQNQAEQADPHLWMRDAQLDRLITTAMGAIATVMGMTVDQLDDHLWETNGAVPQLTRLGNDPAATLNAAADTL